MLKKQPGKERSSTMKIKAIDGRWLEKLWIEDGKDPAHLVEFLKNNPAGHYLSWVKAEKADWGAMGDFDNFKLLQSGRGERKSETAVIKVLIDFEIYQAVEKLQKQGYKLTGSRNSDGIFRTLQKNQRFIGTNYSWEQIRDRYYRFLNNEPLKIIDNNTTLICGPTRVQFFPGCNMIGFWRWTPALGFTLLTPE